MKIRNNKGFSLLELGIVLSIAGILVGAVWVGMSSALYNHKAQKFTQDIILVLEKTKALFAGQGATSVTADFSIFSAAGAGVFPPDMMAGTAAAPVIITPFSNDLTFTSVTLQALPPNQIKFGFPAAGAGHNQGIPTAVCTRILLTLGTVASMQRLGIVNMTGGTNSPDLTTGGTTAVTIQQAANACNVPGNNNVVWVTINVN